MRVRKIVLASVALAAAFALSAPAEAAAPDAWITVKTKLSLMTTEGVSASHINVDTVDGFVTLHGTVHSAQEKAMAEKVTRGIEGARDVLNLLQIAPEGMEIPTLADQELQKQVSARLEKDPALGDSDIQVQSVNQGVVLLGGSAKTLSDHLRAVEDAASVKGVKRVASEIKSPDKLADAEIWNEGKYDAAMAEKSAARDMWITSAAKLRLIANDATPGMSINVDTEDGVVTLFGMVPSEQSKQQAAAEVRKVDGVKTVQNELQVVTKAEEKTTAATDDQIESAVEKRLAARDDLEDAEIAVEVTDGVVRLTGKVKSRADHLTALTVTRATPGVRKLVDSLKFEPPAMGSL